MPFASARPDFALAARLLVNLAASVGWLLTAAVSFRWTAAAWIRLAQLNAIVAAGGTLAWIAAMSRSRTAGVEGRRSQLDCVVRPASGDRAGARGAGARLGLGAI